MLFCCLLPDRAGIVLPAGRFRQVPLKPVSRQLSHSIERSWLFKEVGRSGNNLQAMLRGQRQLKDRFPIETQNKRIVAAHDEQARRNDTAERGTGEIGSSAARNNGSYRWRI